MRYFTQTSHGLIFGRAVGGAAVEVAIPHAGEDVVIFLYFTAVAELWPDVGVCNSVAVIVDAIADFFLGVGWGCIAANPIVRVVAGPHADIGAAIFTDDGARGSNNSSKDFLPGLIDFAVAVVVGKIAPFIGAGVDERVVVVAVDLGRRAVLVGIRDFRG